VDKIKNKVEDKLNRGGGNNNDNNDNY